MAISATRRFIALTTVVFGLVEGCGDELGRGPFAWDAGLGARPPASDAASQDASMDARDGSVRDTSADTTADSSRSDGTGGASVGVDASVGADTSADVEAGLDADAMREAEAGDAPRDAGPVDWLRAMLRAKSSACLPCAEINCPGEFMGCSTVGETPEAGLDASSDVDAGADVDASAAAERDAATMSRPQLCIDTLACAMDTECEAIDTAACYCGSGPRETCGTPKVANGECKARIERSFETTDPQIILDGLHAPDRDTGGGWAFLFARCLRDNACTSCFRRTVSDASTDRDAAAKPDVSVDTSPPPPPPPPLPPPPPDSSSPLPDVEAEAEANAPPADADSSLPDADATDDRSSDTDDATDSSAPDSDSDF